MSKDTLMYCCQSATDAGHIQRALAIAGELAEYFSVSILLGDSVVDTIVAPDGVDLVRLQTQQRPETVLRLFDLLKPRVVAIDSFPFQQYQLKQEFLPLIVAARSGRYGQALVACITDGVLVNNSTFNGKRVDDTADLLDRFFDIAVVRSDPVFARLEEFFQPGNTLHTPLYHTGFVTQHNNTPGSAANRDRDGILVSAGCGAASMALYTSAIEAHRMLQRTLPIPMTIDAETRLADSDWQALRSLAAGLPDLTLRRDSPRARADMAGARWSISQCGYDTAVDAIQTQTPSLFVPSSDPNRRDQIERARRLVSWGAGRLLMPRHMNTASLVNEIHQLTKFEPRGMSFDMNGAANTAQLISQIVYDDNYAPVSAHSANEKRLH